jgi:hypothetical protein
MKPIINSTIYCLAAIILSCNQNQVNINITSTEPGNYDSTWWNRTPLRFVQTNLREIDAYDMIIDDYVQSLIDASVNFVLLSVGGQVANYPTKLSFHYRNPYINGDLVGDAVRSLQENGIRVMARFDFSRLNESIALENPDWLYVGTHGGFVNYNGQVHTCINGAYQQKYGFEILREAIMSYPFDAIFFNMAGYVTSDYSQVYHGICQCNNCKTRFYDSTGYALPLRPDMNDHVYRLYADFQRTTHTELNNRITRFIQDLDPKLILCVYNPDGGIFRSESGTAFTSDHYWNYHATENVKRVLGSFNNRSPFDTYNYLMGMDYRHVATSPNIGRLFLPQQMLNGGALGIYFIGHMNNQYDRVFLPAVKDIYKFHQTHEEFFTNLKSQSSVGLIMGSGQENRGIMKMLIEEHIMFDLIFASAIGTGHLPRKLEDYDVLILSNISNMDDIFISVIDDYVKSGGKILATGFPGINDETGKPLNNIRLRSLGVLSDFETLNEPRSSYLLVTEKDKARLGQSEFHDFDLIMMNSRFLKVKPIDNMNSFLKLIPNIMHGPPEKCYFTDSEITDFPGLIANEFGKGEAVFIPWQIGSQYYWKGNNAQRALFLSALQNILKVTTSLETNASPLIEMTHMINRNEAFEWIGMINHSGQLGNAFREPVEIHNTTIRVKPQKPIKTIYLMRADEEVKFKQSEEWVEFIVPKVWDFEMALCVYK